MLQVCIILKKLLLKVLSSELNPAKIRFILKVFIKERDVENFRKSVHFPSLESPLKLQGLLEIRERIPNTGMKFIPPERLAALLVK
jgi:hypothetical protein